MSVVINLPTLHTKEPDTMARHQVERIRHETRRRTLTVETAEKLTPNMLRISFTADDLHDFVGLSADDHVKLFFPVDGKPDCMRDYTPRLFDTARSKLAIDFALHEAGVATRWATAANIGDTLDIGGPRGSPSQVLQPDLKLTRRSVCRLPPSPTAGRLALPVRMVLTACLSSLV